MSSPAASNKAPSKPGEEVVFLPTHTSSNPCGGKVFTVEMHHKRVEGANPGDNVGMNVKGLDKLNMPRSGDVMVYKADTSLAPCKEFTAQVQTLDIPGELKTGYSPIGFVRCGRSACKMTALNFKVGKETGGKKLEGPASLKSNEVAECVFEPVHPMVVDSFKKCEVCPVSHFWTVTPRSCSVRLRRLPTRKVKYVRVFYLYARNKFLRLQYNQIVYITNLFKLVVCVVYIIFNK